MRDNAQSRKWMLTVNNPDKAEITLESILEILHGMTLAYFCLAYEIGAQGTYHIHIFIYSESPIRFSTLKNRFPIAHLEKSYGTVKENRDYISKSGKWENTDKVYTKVEGSFMEWGHMPAEAEEKAPDMSRVIHWIEEGLSTTDIIRNNPKLAFKIREIDLLRENILSDKYMIANRENIEVNYIYGKTGTGKTHSIYQKYNAADICRITNYKGSRILFDGYHGQNVLVLEEFHGQIPLADLLSYLDKYPLMLPARYADKVACYSVVYIVSNVRLSQQYYSEKINDRDTWDALIRRISNIYEQVDKGLQVRRNKEETWTW